MDINNMTDEDLQTILDGIAERVPKIMITVASDGKYMAHLLGCPIGEKQARAIYVMDEPLPVTKCICMELPQGEA